MHQWRKLGGPTVPEENTKMDFICHILTKKIVVIWQIKNWYGEIDVLCILKILSKNIQVQNLKILFSISPDLLPEKILLTSFKYIFIFLQSIHRPSLLNPRGPIHEENLQQFLS